MIEELKLQIQANQIDAIGTRARAKDIMGAQERVILADLERQKLDLTIDVLTHPELKSLVSEGFITFGMIKPHAEDNLYLPKDDEKAADLLLSKIEANSGLDLVIAQPILFTPDTVAQFYAGNKERFEEINIWKSFVEYTTSGPATALMLYDPEGDAIKKWRDFIGKTNPEEAGPETIRGRYARRNNLPNNLVHGSGNSEEALTEVGIFAGILTSLQVRLDRDAYKAPSLDSLAARAGVPHEENVLFAVEQPIEIGDGWNVHSVDQAATTKRDKQRIDHVRHALSTLSFDPSIGNSPHTEGK